AVQQHELRHLAGLDRSEVVQAPASQRSVLRTGNDRLRGRHAEFDESFNRDDRADAMVLNVGLRIDGKLRSCCPIAVGSDRYNASAGDQLLSRAAADLEIDTQVARLSPFGSSSK